MGSISVIGTTSCQEESAPVLHSGVAIFTLHKIIITSQPTLEVSYINVYGITDTTAEVTALSFGRLHGMAATTTVSHCQYDYKIDS